MTRALKATLLFCLSLLLTACAGTKLTQTWHDPAYHAGPFSSILVIGVARQEPLRRSFENKFVNRLTALGVKAFASHTVLPLQGKLKKEAVVSALKRVGADAVLITHVMDIHEKEVNVPYQIGGFYDYYGRIYDYVHQSGYTTMRVKVMLETNLWETKTEKMVWSGQSESVNPESKMQMFDDVIDAVVKNLQKNKLLPAPK